MSEIESAPNAPIHTTAGDTTLQEIDERTRRILLCLGLVLLLFLYVGRIAGFPLQDPDEGRYAEVAREMIETGDWVTPHLNYVSYFHKPPLLYWTSAISFSAFGENEFGARFPVALAGMFVVLLTYALGRRMFGERGGILAAALLATTPLFFVLSQALVMDMLLTACTTSALASVYALRTSAAKRTWASIVALWIALGFLTKGPIAGVLVGLVAAPFLLLERDWESLRALVGWRPILVFLAVAVPWFVLVSNRNPDFLEVFFVDHHLRRFSGEIGHKETSLFYFVPVILAGCAPWTFLAALMALDGRLRATYAAIPATPRLFLWLWAGAIFGFFSLSSTKLPTYMAPALPALALLLGAWVDRALTTADTLATPLRRLAVLFACIGVVLTLIASFAANLPEWLASQLRVDVADVRTMIGPVGGVGVALTISGLLVARRGIATHSRPTASVAILIGAMAVALFSAVAGRAVVKTSRDVARAIQQEHRDGDLVVAFDHVFHGLSFYLGDRIVQSGDPGELAPGAARDGADDSFFWTRDRLVEEWTSGRRVFVATDVRRLHELPDDLAPPPRVLARDLKRVVLVNFDPG